MFASEWFSMCGSRAHSYVSMKSDWSMGQPYDFKGDVPYPHSSWIQKDSSDCPSPSLSMKSDKSMDRLFNFKTPIRSPELRIQKESSDCPFQSCLSMKSDESMDPPMSFKSQIRSPELSEFSSSLLTADHVRCSVCSSILRDPVSIPCGHSYCKHCINTYWSQPGPAGDYVCLQCEKSYPVRPELSINVALNWMLQAHQQTVCSPVCPTLPQAAPGHVACDVCSSLTRRAIKTCLTCSASYCENHLAHHYTVPALQKHTLVQINEDTRLIDLRMEIKEVRAMFVQICGDWGINVCCEIALFSFSIETILNYGYVLSLSFVFIIIMSVKFRSNAQLNKLVIILKRNVLWIVSVESIWRFPVRGRRRGGRRCILNYKFS